MSPISRCVLLALLALPLLAGCGSAIREDRSITFTSDGKQVAFQHGRNGIFVVETEGAAPTKIFEPDADVIAVSTPSWSPIDKRLIFTTARDAEKDQPAHGLPIEQDPAGNLHSEKPAQYTCWLRTEPKPGQPLNVPLFTVRCGHPGYVAANLAVRWHPDGQRILYIKEDDTGRHGLFEYDLRSKSSRQVFPHTARSLVFDWAPDNAHLVCVLGENGAGSPIAGTWIGKPGEAEWWHVPNSSELGMARLNELRDAHPIWANDGNRFAFVTVRPQVVDTPAVYTLHLGSLDTRTVQEMAKSDKPIRDLHWRPDGARLGFLRGDDPAVFHLIDPATKNDRIIGGNELFNFLGWDATGEQLAFVARQPFANDPAKSWAFLFLPDVRARNVLLVAPDADPTQRRGVFSGLQVTFPRWSPKEAKLSLWATFRPLYRSWLSHLLDLGANPEDPLRGLTLRAGDPALLLDPATGERNWKAIDAHEKTQVGHYHLMRREYAEAWRWYKEAAWGAPDADDHSPQQFVERFVRGRDALFFQAYCLDKLGRSEEADAKRRLFDKTFLPDLFPPAKAPVPGQLTAFGAADIKPTRQQLRHWRNLYIAEVFLSLDALDDGERFFRAALHAADSEAERLSTALVLTQFLLLRDKREEYAELATDTVLPLLLRTWKPRNQVVTGQNQANNILAYSDGLSLVPLFASEFLARLPDQQVRDLVRRWEKLRPSADDDVKRLGLDLFLEAAAHRLGNEDEHQAAAQRIAANPARNEILGEKGIDGLIEGVRKAPELFEAVHQMGLGH